MGRVTAPGAPQGTPHPSPGKPDRLLPGNQDQIQQGILRPVATLENHRRGTRGYQLVSRLQTTGGILYQFLFSNPNQQGGLSQVRTQNRSQLKDFQHGPTALLPKELVTQGRTQDRIKHPRQTRRVEAQLSQKVPHFTHVLRPRQQPALEASRILHGHCSQGIKSPSFWGSRTEFYQAALVLHCVGSHCPRKPRPRRFHRLTIRIQPRPILSNSSHT